MTCRLDGLAWTGWAVMIPVVGRRMNLLLASSSSIAPLPPLPPPLLHLTAVRPPMWIHTCSCACSSCSGTAVYSLAEIQSGSSSPFPHRHGIGLESSCRLDSATCSFRGQFPISQSFFPFLFKCVLLALARIGPSLASSYSRPIVKRTGGHRGSFLIHPWRNVRPTSIVLGVKLLSVQCSSFNKNTQVAWAKLLAITRSLSTVLPWRLRQKFFPKRFHLYVLLLSFGPSRSVHWFPLAQWHFLIDDGNIFVGYRTRSNYRERTNWATTPRCRTT